MRKSFAEYLHDFAERALAEKRITWQDTGTMTPEQVQTSLARIRLAIEFYRRPPVFVFRSMMEEWDQQTLIREMY
jgi:hypothetical protein